MTRTGILLTLILVAAGILRLHAAATRPFIGDEGYLAIHLADRISLSPSHLNLPIRGRDHPALPSYVIKLSVTLFGLSQLGYRALDVFCGVISIFLIFRITSRLFGSGAGLWAAALLAFNEYHIVVSSLATAKGPHLFFVTVAIYAFTRFLSTQRSGFLYGAAAAVALAFYCKEHSVLLLVAFFLTLLLPDYRGWLRGRHVYLACALFALLVLPDVAANLQAASSPEAQVQGAAPATYRDHLARIGGLGLSPYPTVFFVRDGLMWVWAHVSGNEVSDRTPEYPSMNTGLGLILLLSVGLWTFKPPRGQPRFLLILFWVFFAFFSLIRPGHPIDRMDPVTWYWVDAALFPAVVFAGSVLADSARPVRLLQFAAVGTMVLAVARMTIWVDV